MTAASEDLMGRPLREVLEDYKKSKISLEEADELIRGYVCIGEEAKFDLDRKKRRGVPEIVLAEGKSEDDVVEIARGVYKRTGAVIVSRVSPSLAQKLKKLGRCSYEEKARMAVLKERDAPRSYGSIGIISAGTSDIPVAEEARIVAEEIGCEVVKSYDVGVAGIHRVFPALKEMRERKVDAIIVVAGMEGSLPSIVAGLVDVPVIGVPTSQGYGYGGRGKASLMSMLQSCSSGLVVVNIDNGVGAGMAAVLISKVCYGASKRKGRQK